ncbi:L-histidine N(alpha)-methyltransferase [Aliterella atlantica]|uniref:L-histidine N(alpha)-methyltransferase n=1 Tax=Aliterella atlantica TaxID=1827278 RepID=UPI000698134F|nr:L-histidine N(alpha)-methyltransferase [Aliterella atlantica]
MEASEGRRIVEQALEKAKTRSRIDTLQWNIFNYCWEVNRTKYEQIAEETKYDIGHISNMAAQLWSILQEALFEAIADEKVTKQNYRTIVERYAEMQQQPKNQQSLQIINAKVLISDRSQKENFNTVEQIIAALNVAVREVSVIEESKRTQATYLELFGAELRQCDCLVMLLSHQSASVSEIILEEIKYAQKLRNSRSDSKLAILLVHIDSVMELPLNHNLHSYLQDIVQYEWKEQTGIPSLVQKISELLEADKSSVSQITLEERHDFGELEKLLQNISGINKDNWLLTYVGEDQLRNLSTLVNDLKNEGHRRVQSRYSYWGVSPTRMWTQVCNDPAYHMLENIRSFPSKAKELAHLVDKERYNFISLGVGEGSKDSSIIADFFTRSGDRPHEDFLYIPVDMSLDMLRVAIGRIRGLPLHRRIAIQRDIETDDGIEEIARIAKNLGQGRPIVYGFIGNTIANVEEPEKVLNNIVQVMTPDDLLLFEAQVVTASVLEEHQLQMTKQYVKEEYKNFAFQQFAFSALLQNSDLSVNPNVRDDKCYVVNVDLQPWIYGQILQIDCFFENNSGEELQITFAYGDRATLSLQEKIRLYRSRKFTQQTLQNFVKGTGLEVLGKSECLSHRDTGFVVMLLKRQL